MLGRTHLFPLPLQTGQHTGESQLAVDRETRITRLDSSQVLFLGRSQSFSHRKVRPRPRAKMPEQSNDYRVVVFGAGGVGKSSLVLRFVKGTFRDTYIPTIEDTYRQVISCDKSVCTLQITDTTGSHQFPAMQRLSISKGHAFILVFSITSRQSLEELKPIYQQILQIKGSVETIPIMLVGNKCDETQREVEAKEGEAVAKEPSPRATPSSWSSPSPAGSPWRS
uniref:DIRAS family GTPase 1 n=1 Tax=Pelodiscus sinensis TaxID=13735 RepID=K7F3R0_PELSI